MISPTPWIERKFEFHFPSGIFPIIIEPDDHELTKIRGLLAQYKA